MCNQQSELGIAQSSFHKLSSVMLAASLLTIAACSERVETSDVTTLSSLTYAATPGDDAPELAHLGPYRVGVRTLKFQFEDQDDISLLGYGTGYVPKTTRNLSVDFLYPADIPTAQPPNAIYHGFYHTVLTDIDGLPTTFEVSGTAVRDALAVTGQRFPLVIFSHGLATTPGVMSGITENLASKGYVVASIDHHDADPDVESSIHVLGRTLINRSLDQQRILAEVLKLTEIPASKIGIIIDANSIALIGFSMGGYGVLNHAGAGYDVDGEAFNIVPNGLMESQSEHNVEYQSTSRDHIDAIVTLAPWGGVSAWTDTALANINAPMLMLAGSQDDVSNFDDGIARIFNKAVGCDRHLLVFQNASHNIAQVAAPSSAHLDIRPWSTFEDPTWRRQRLLDVSNHFITAFLDWHLKGKTSRKAYFDVPTVLSNDGTWEQSFGEDHSDRYADGSDGSESYWRGFKRRQALGLELHSLEKGETR